MIEQYLGIESDYIIFGLAGCVIIMFIMLIVTMGKLSGLRKRYDSFMAGSDGKSLEETILSKLEKVDALTLISEQMEKDIDILNKKMKNSVQKVGILKYDALDEMGGKLSYALALLDEKNNGCIINNVHSRTGSYNYIKEVIDSHSIVALSPEEEEALNKALEQEV